MRQPAQQQQQQQQQGAGPPCVLLAPREWLQGWHALQQAQQSQAFLQWLLLPMQRSGGTPQGVHFINDADAPAVLPRGRDAQGGAEAAGTAASMTAASVGRPDGLGSWSLGSASAGLSWETWNGCVPGGLVLVSAVSIQLLPRASSWVAHTLQSTDAMHGSSGNDGRSSGNGVGFAYIGR